MSTPAARIGDGDRLSLTGFLSVAVHALVVLGVGFTWQTPEAGRPPPMIEVTLADRPQEQTPDDFDYLAQANQDGGGELEERARPEQPQQALMPGLPEGRQALDSAPAPSDAARPDQLREIAGANVASAADVPTPEPPREQAAATLINAPTSLAAASALSQAYESVSARYPSKRRISARTRSHAAAAYMREWVDEVERIGNLNYPAEARRRAYTGRLILEVTLRPSGEVHDIKVLRPSPHPILDQAAIRTVKLASPFARVPQEVLEGNDLLVITRTWQFEDGRRVQTR